MAPHAETSLFDTSGYSPPENVISELKKSLRLFNSSAGAVKWISEGPQIVDSHDRESDEHDFVLQLSLDDIQEIEDAFISFKATTLPLNKLQAENFPLPTLSSRIRKLSVGLVDQHPYFIIRGLKPQWFSKYKNVVIFTGIASHVGTKRALAPGDPNVLHHVTNIPISSEKECTTYRGPANRTIALPFHTDYGSILSLYVLSRPASGGAFHLADIHDITSRIARTRPDILETLRKPYIMVNPKIEGGFDERPLLFTQASGRLAIQASRSRIFGTATRLRPNYLPSLTAKQIEAVDALHAAGQEVSRRFDFKSGDMMFCNNLRLMHARDSFLDGNEDENTTKRYLLRLILHDERNDSRWDVPDKLKNTWKELYDHEDEEEIFTIHPELFSFKAGH
ncbi:Clavaminate synthase-like protein [Lindgomyces ingoldianus]|uniref:Clavaminate synthase-like protein n=1 Tax=Lindgomyces ingoldianus TaxID=673940 RepID=A0ACB6R3W4_9PLEO|nr:Clavaminate synthase-like protein [Lindgomyces ingoldianus]KAF2473831.1 Clavaminate synthase-like protein [Lindgomyces ingoldianus]